MIKHITLRLITVCCLMVFIGCQSKKDVASTEDLLSTMKTKNDGKWFENFRFKQHTIRFNEEGKKIDSTVWYESVGYPYNFRIDRDVSQGIYTIFKNDSTYNFKNDTLVRTTNKPATHLLFKGGLYFISLEETLAKLKKYNYDVSAFRKDVFKGEHAYVVGEEDNQFWIHAENFYCMRRIYKTDNNQKVDVVYEDFKPLDKGWVEQKVTFFVAGKKRLEEFYFDIKTIEEFDKRIYDVNQNYKWYTNY
nr:hypothetical protein [uncultured Allomuricauda sp.]